MTERRPGRSMIVFPTGQSASQREDYFDIFDDYIRLNSIKSSIVIYPKSLIKIVGHAGNLTKRTSLVPVPMHNPFIGTEDYQPALKIMFSSITRNSPDTLHIVTSGGTTKIGNLATLTGNIAEKFGIEVRYIWAAKDSHGNYRIEAMPKVTNKQSSEFDVVVDEGEITILHPVN